MRKRDGWDYVIVGGGSAGCVLANRLSEDRTTRVLLLEAGGRDWNPLFRIPVGTMKIGGKHDWQVSAEPDPSRNGKIDRWAAGKVLGGGSSVNAMFWARGNRGDFDRWAADGCEGWGFDDVLPYFRRAESFDAGADASRGGDGPQHVSRLRVAHPMTERFVEAAEQAGHARNPDYNGARQEGVSYAQYSQKRGLRDSTSRAYLGPARFRRNLTVRTHAPATRVRFDGTRAVGVEYRQGGQSRVAHARCEVILAAGALASPKLLMLSGVGPADDLDRLGIHIVAPSPGVGKNLQEHPYAPMMFGVTIPTLNVDTSPRALIRHGLEFLIRRRGPVTSGGVHAVVFARTDPDSDIPEVEILFAPFGVHSGVGEAGDHEAGDEISHDVHAMKLVSVAAVTVYPSVLHPSGRGVLRLRSADPADPPIIEHHLIGDEADRVALRDACRMVRDIFSRPALRPLVAKELVPGSPVQTDEQFDLFLRGAAFGGQHPISTCRMGSDGHAVVDARLRVRGVEGLRVVDASVMPSLVSGHTNAATIMIAEKASDLIRADRLDPRASR